VRRRKIRQQGGEITRILGRIRVLELKRL